jgi:hypothetical protein
MITMKILIVHISFTILKKSAINGGCDKWHCLHFTCVIACLIIYREYVVATTSVDNVIFVLQGPHPPLYA